MECSFKAEQDFLHTLIMLSKTDYKTAIQSATPLQIRAIVECLINLKRFFHPHKQQITNVVQDIVSECLVASTYENLESIVIESRRIVQQVLAKIFLQVLTTEVCICMSQDGQGNESNLP